MKEILAEGVSKYVGDVAGPHVAIFAGVHDSRTVGSHPRIVDYVR